MEEDIAATSGSSVALRQTDPVTLVFGQRQAQYLTLCSLCVLLWDILITIDQEVEYIWKSRRRFTFIKVLFHLNRIWVPATFAARTYRYFTTTPSAETCLNMGTFVLWSMPVNIFVIQAALATRVWALYGQSRIVLSFFVFLVCGSAISSATIIGLATRTLRAPKGLRHKGTPLITNCNSVNAPPPLNFNSIFYCALLVEVVLFLMMICQVIRHGRSQTRAPLITHIGRTGTVFFFLAMVAILFALVGSYIPAINSPARTSNFITAILSINCSRLILSIRDACNVPLQSLHLTTEMDMPQFAPTYSKDLENPPGEVLEDKTAYEMGVVAAEDRDPT